MVNNLAGLIEQKIPANREEVEVDRASFWRQFCRDRAATIALIFILGLIALAIVGPQIVPHDPLQQNLRAASMGPNRVHWLGTDNLGRDTLSRIIIGTRISMLAALQGVGIAALLGIPTGLLAGYVGGRVERMIMWIVDVLFALPPLVVAFAIIAILGAGLTNAMLAVGLVLSTRYARLTRGMALAEREELYVEAARAVGLKTPRILSHHILPNIAPSLIAQSSLLFGAVILIEAVLSFVGLGLPVGEPSWGRMLADARPYLRDQPFLSLPPGLAISLTVLAFNLFGGGLEQSLGGNKRSILPGTGRDRKAQSQTKATPSHPSTSAKSSQGALLEINALDVAFPGPGHEDLMLLQDLTLAIQPGEILGLVGESGSGKSMTALSTMGLLPSPGRIQSGTIRFNGKDVTDQPEERWQQLRGREIAMIFQDPMSALNPALTVGEQISEPLQLHLGLNRRAARERAVELLALMRVPDPQRRSDAYPHQLSGGMAQRVVMARALACDPKLLIADEPTSALDVTVQGQMLDLLAELRETLGMAILFITHDFGAVARLCDRVAVMYAGQIVEVAQSHVLFASPQHPYSAALLATTPHIHDQLTARLPMIEGMVPPPHAWPRGCHFHPRCRFAVETCSTTEMPLHDGGNGRLNRCMRAADIDPTYATRPDYL